MKYYKYHALGNDYIVLNPNEIGFKLNQSQIQKICHRNYGVGSDGILYGPIKDTKNEFVLKIFNPDGSEAEKSGNGLRIFSRYLWDEGLIKDNPFPIITKGGRVKSQIFENGRNVTVEMGQLSFQSQKIPIPGPPREVINEKISVNGKELTFCAATIGNPHCVILRENVSESEIKKWGPLIENDKLFPNRTNVQFMQILDSNNIKIEIWERGAGYTLASGSSSSAAAGVAYRLGLCDSNITVHMPGGQIKIEVLKKFFISMTGSVTKVATGIIDDELFSIKLPDLL